MKIKNKSNKITDIISNLHFACQRPISENEKNNVHNPKNENKNLKSSSSQFVNVTTKGLQTRKKKLRKKAIISQFTFCMAMTYIRKQK